MQMKLKLITKVKRKLGKLTVSHSTLADSVLSALNLINLIAFNTVHA